MVKRYLFILFLLTSFAAGCGGGSSVRSTSISEEEAGPPEEIGNVNSKLLSKGLPAAATSPDDYLIGPADLLEINVFESKELTTTVRVSSRGDITVPLLNNVNVDGLTARDAEVKIENLLRSGDYIDNPHVSVFVKEHKSKVVAVMGYVNKPGNYELLGKQSLLDVLASAEGLSDKAGTTVLVTRADNNGGKSSYLVDLDKVVSGNGADMDLDIQPGDLVYVPEAANVFVEGAVTKPGAYPINQGKTTLSEAIVMAGGVASYADKSDIKLIHHTDSGRKEIVEVDLNSIHEGGAEDPLLNEKDAVIVGASGIKKFFYGLQFNIWGLGGVGYNPPRN
ncbi:MAG: polysaccharide biosynthesis/export family protein [Thermodesulfobacteriota bacterium]